MIVFWVEKNLAWLVEVRNSQFRHFQKPLGWFREYFLISRINEDVDTEHIKRVNGLLISFVRLGMRVSKQSKTSNIISKSTLNTSVGILFIYFGVVLTIHHQSMRGKTH